MMMTTAMKNDARQHHCGGSKFTTISTTFCFDTYVHYFGAHARSSFILLSFSSTFFLSLPFSLVPVKCLLCSFHPSNPSPTASGIAFMTWPLVSHDDAADHTADPHDALASTTPGPRRPDHIALVESQNHTVYTPAHGYSFGWPCRLPFSLTTACPPSQPTRLIPPYLVIILTTTTILMMMTPPMTVPPFSLMLTTAPTLIFTSTTTAPPTVPVHRNKNPNSVPQNLTQMLYPSKLTIVLLLA